MMTFWKMNGAGNDFVVIDNRALTQNLSQEQIARLCDRHRGVGADGLLAVEPAEQGADLKMRYYNADGGEAEMCGNGARCFARFANFLSDWTLATVRFETPAGIIGATFHGDHVRLAMSAPHDLRRDVAVPDVAGVGTVDFINTGVPHAVQFVSDLAAVPVLTAGAALRYHAQFAPKGTNANFAAVVGPSALAIRTYERGVEGETLACGTGMVACALLHHLRTGDPSPIAITVAGGETLAIGFARDGDTFSDVTLTGPADLVFSGQVEV
jgi:diaminopimelate epimerase